MSNHETNDISGAKLGQGRSPAYPYVDLRKAIDRVREVYDAGAGRGAYPPGTYYKIWEIGPKSSAARQVLAALNHFGLVSYEGRGNDRKVRLSELALKILQDKRPQSEERASAIHQAALTPPIHQRLFDQFPAPLPDDVFIEHFLVGEAGYNEAAATSLIKEFKSTLDFAELSKPDIMPVSDSSEANIDEKNDDDTQFGDAKIGDLIQWESDGALRLEGPRRVRAVSDDGQWVFVEESETGIPMSEVKVEEQAVAAPSGGIGKSEPPTLALTEKPPLQGSRKEVFDLDEGQVVLTFPENLSKTSFEDLDAYLKVFIGKMRRRAGVSTPENEGKNDEG